MQTTLRHSTSNEATRQRQRTALQALIIRNYRNKSAHRCTLLLYTLSLLPVSTSCILPHALLLLLLSTQWLPSLLALVLPLLTLPLPLLLRSPLLWRCCCRHFTTRELPYLSCRRCCFCKRYKGILQPYC